MDELPRWLPGGSGAGSDQQARVRTRVGGIVSPILIRPVREQIEHDRVIRVIHARLRGEFDVESNLGDDRRASLRIGQRTHYPDVVFTVQGAPRKIAGVVEVETAESVNYLEAMAQWAHFGRTKAPFYLYVPVAMVDIARRLVQDYHAVVTELWSYAAVGDHIHFWLVQALPASTTPAGTEYSVPIDGGHLAPRPEDEAEAAAGEEAGRAEAGEGREGGAPGPEAQAKPEKPARPVKPAAAPAAEPKPAAGPKPKPPSAKPPAKPAAPPQAAAKGAPAKPAKPPKAAKPAKPAQPARPAKPVKPAAPAKPAKSAKPARPVKPAKPAKAAKPPKPAGKATAPPRASKTSKPAAKRPAKATKAVGKPSSKAPAAKAAAKGKTTGAKKASVRKHR